MSSEGASLSALPPIKPEANATEFGVSRASLVQRKPLPFFLRASLPGVGTQGSRAGGGSRRPLAAPRSSAGRSRSAPGRPTAITRVAALTPNPPEGRAPSPGRCHKHPAPASLPPPSWSVNPSLPAARLREGGRPGGGVVASPPGSARADARLVYRPQAPGLVATSVVQAPRRPPARPRPDFTLTRSSRGQAGPWSAEAAAATAAGEGAGRGSPRLLPTRSGRGGGRGGEEPGCVRDPGSRCPRGSDHPGVGAGGGERVPKEEEEEPKIHRYRAPPAWSPPHPPSPATRS